MILDSIVAKVRERLDEKKKIRPLARLMTELANRPASRDFEAALKKADFGIIAEIKKASPAKGWLHEELDILKQARLYEQGDAAAVSVLTEPDAFKGSLADLRAVREAVKLPVLRKDFILEEYQVYEAAVNGADALLLITAILEAATLDKLIKLSYRMGITPLVEVHSEAEARTALGAGAQIIGINNRNLADFTVDLDTSLRVRPLIPPEVLVVSESGISTQADVAKLKAAGINAILVGEALVKASDPLQKIRELLS